MSVMFICHQDWFGQHSLEIEEYFQSYFFWAVMIRMGFCMVIFQGKFTLSSSVTRFLLRLVPSSSESKHGKLMIDAIVWQENKSRLLDLALFLHSSFVKSTNGAVT